VSRGLIRDAESLLGGNGPPETREVKGRDSSGGEIIRTQEWRDGRWVDISTAGRFRESPSVAVTVENNEGFGDLSPQLQTAALEAAQKSDTISRQADEMEVMQTMMMGADTGILTPVTLPIKQAFESIGITLDEDVPLLESIRSQQNQLALRLRNPDSGFGLTGNTSNRDLTFLTNAVPGLANSPMGNQAVAIIMTAKMRREALIERGKAEWLTENGSLAGWFDARDKLVDETPFFTDEQQTFLDSLVRPGSELPGYEDLTPAERAELRELEEEANASRL